MFSTGLTLRSIILEKKDYEMLVYYIQVNTFLEI